MTPELNDLMVRMLASDDPTEREHARRRLSRPDAISYEKPEGWTPDPPPALVPLSVSIRAMRLGFRRCFYSDHSGCGCSGTKCFHLARVVGLADCISCLENCS